VPAHGRLPTAHLIAGGANCVGDIGNMNGRLTCNYADAPAQPQPDDGPDYGPPPPPYGR